jgi:hypothetical protein
MGSVTVKARDVLVAVSLVAVPTFFTLYPEAGRWPLWVRVCVGAGWVATAAVGSLAVARRDKELDSAVTTLSRERRQLRQAASGDLLRALLGRGEGRMGVPDHYTFTVFVYRRDARELVAVWPHSDRGRHDIFVFRPGQGATGDAFQSGEFVLVTGAEVSDASRRLTPAQQAFYADYQTVVATPIWEDGDQPVGALSGLSEQLDDYFKQPHARIVLRQLADDIAVLLASMSADFMQVH